MPKVLIVDDEPNLLHTLRYNLRQAGYDVVLASTGDDAITVAAREQPNIIVLDVMLPGLDGFEVCRRIRSESSVPILMLTARTEEVDRVVGLEVGADDYLTKPFSVRELLARVRAMLRRVDLLREASAGAAAPALLVAGPLRVDLAQHVASLEGRPLELTPKEFDLLALLVRHPGRAYARDYLMEAVWGYESGGFDRTVDTHILRLRKKLGAA